jgi:multidrug efflux system membrane fusion protein
LNLRNSRTRVVLLTVVVLLALAIYAIVQWLRPAPPPKAAQAIPADIVAVQPGDFPVIVEGLGTVQAFYTVTITARVDGQIEKVAFTEGQEVAKGALLVQIDPRPYQAALDQARATLDKDAAQLANANRDLERYNMLAPDDLASKQTIDTQHALVAQLEAQLKGDQAAIDSAKTNLDYTTITSPITGRTGIRLVDPGNIVHAAGTTGIVMVTQLHPIAVIFSLPEDEFDDLNAALHRGPVGVRAVSRDHEDELDRGTVSLIDNQIDQTTGTIKVKAIFPNTGNRLWPGEFVNVQALLETRHNVLTIPASALQRGPDGAFTYVVDGESTIHVVDLKTGGQSGDRVLVTAGLQAGQQVVASNQYRLQPNAKVRPNTHDKTQPGVAADGKPQQQAAPSNEKAAAKQP